jgi:hypothetical protein
MRRPFRVITVSIYEKDLARWDRLIAELRKRGYTSANRSALVRYAMRQLDLDDFPEAPLSGRLDDIKEK